MRFKGHLKASLKKADMTHGDVEEIAEDRQRWRSDCGAGVSAYRCAV